MVKAFKYIFIFLPILLSNVIYSQARTNLEVIHSLIDQSVSSISQNITDSSTSYAVSFNTADEYIFLKNRLMAQLSYGRSINLDSLSADNMIIYNLDFAGIKYSETFKSGVFGGFRVSRTTAIKGSYQITGNKSIQYSEMIEYSVVDTVAYDEIAYVEQPALPFNRAELPPEPFLPTLVEPLIAIGAVVITVILFFTVRTK